MDRLRYLDFVIDTMEAQDATLDTKGRPSHFLLRVFDPPAG